MKYVYSGVPRGAGWSGLLFPSLLLGAGGWAAAQEPPPRPEAPVPGESSLNVFNPTISVFGNAVLRLDNRDVVEEMHGETVVLDDRFLFREAELDFRAAIDPYADAVLILAAHAHVPGEYEVEIEEGYFNIKSLPFPLWEEPPLGTELKVGRFLTSTGILNRLHTHDLPQTNSGLTFENFFGHHHYGADGISARLHLPSVGDSALTLTGEAVMGGGWKMGHDGGDRPAFVANLNWFNTFWDEHDLDVSLVGTYGSNDEEGKRQTQLVSADLFYRWRPLRGGQWTSFLLAGQAFYGSREYQDEDTLESGTQRALGVLSYAQFQLDRRWYFGVRYDWTEHLEDRFAESHRLNPCITCYISEFFRIRVGYEHTWSDLEELDGLKTFLLELNVVFGAHPPHPYWANF